MRVSASNQVSDPQRSFISCSMGGKAKQNGLARRDHNPCVATAHPYVCRCVKAEIQKKELCPREINQRKLVTGTVRERRLAARGVEKPIVDRTVQTVTVTQVAASARKMLASTTRG